MKVFILCLTICLVRIIDTSLSTIRTILIIRNKKKISTIIAFIEVLIWFLVVKEAVNTKENAILIGISYSFGYALGVLIGMILTEKLVKTNINVNIVIRNNKKEIIKELINKNFAFSINKIKGKNFKERKYMLFIVTNNKKLSRLEEIVYKYDKKAFMVVTDNRKVSNGS